MSAAAGILLDKDGTLVVDVPFNVDPARIRPTPGALEGVRRLHEAGYRIAVVSNQSGVALGHFAESALGAVEASVRRLLAEAGVPLAGFYYCPHHPDVDGECDCRKPRPGLLRRAAAELGLDLARSWMIGDILNDVEAGRRAGCRTVLLDNGNETEWVLTPGRRPHLSAATLAEAAERILGAPPPAAMET